MHKIVCVTNTKVICKSKMLKKILPPRLVLALIKLLIHNIYSSSLQKLVMQLKIVA